ncbi:MAG: CBS domain-containing protein [Flavobacteriales bacterium]|nr:CBS domain-containing protein [Flavobacteriales bacterium]
MLATDLIEEDVPVVSCDTTVDEVLEIMTEYKTSQLPVVERGDLIGIVTDTDIDDRPKGTAIEMYKNEFLEYMINEQQLVHDVVKVLKEHDLVLVPVINNERKYLGSITPRAIVDYYGKTLAIEHGCSVFVLRMNRNDYSLGEIAQIAEGNNAKIFAVQVFPELDEKGISVVLSIKTEDNSGLLQSFHRYEYNVTASYDKDQFHEDLKNRFEELMKYINM